jgi:hypothetical protein
MAGKITGRQARCALLGTAADFFAANRECATQPWFLPPGFVVDRDT